MTNLIKVTNTYRVPTVTDALRLQKELEKLPGDLTTFKYSTKYIKVKGEIEDEYQLVTATIQFTNEKEPEGLIREFYGAQTGEKNINEE